MTVGLLSFASPAIIIPSSLLKINLSFNASFSSAPANYTTDANPFKPPLGGFLFQSSGSLPETSRNHPVRE